MNKPDQDYQMLAKQLKSLLEGESYPLTNFSQFSAFIYNNLADLNWSGFYLLTKSGELQLGPFQGQVACTRIPQGKGVCGKAARERESQLILNVDSFDGHIACDSRSRSELVCPILNGKQLIGVFDIDSPSLARFDEKDKLGIEQLINILVDTTDLEQITKWF